MLTFGIEPWIVPCLFAGIHMDPSSLMLGIDLGEHVILRVPDPAHSCASSTTQHAETIGPFTASASSGLQQRPDIRISWEAFVSIAVGVAAAIKLYLACSTSSFVRGWRRQTLRHGGGTTDGAVRVFDKGEEGSTEPSQQGFDDAILVAPFGLDIVTHGGS
jgi:hypothetical protein